MIAVLGLAAATFVSEDAACIAAGLLVQRGEIDLIAALIGCGLGIFLGDCGLWAIGRIGACFIHSEPLRGRLERYGGWAVVGSRFVPGTRLPLYLAAGATRMSGVRFALSAFLATLLWTPTVVVATAQFGVVLTAHGPTSASRWLGLFAATAMFLLLRVYRAAAEPTRRRRIAASLERWGRWEFWPLWLFYPPVALWMIWLAFRHGGIRTITAANPGIADGGVVGESKFEILSRLPPDATIPTTLISPGPSASRVRAALAQLDVRGWEFPVIAKPDVGQRGIGVKLVSNADALTHYLSREKGAVLLQPYHAGPYEAGVFYYRFPGSSRGRVFSITDKQFPFVTGDGRSTLAELVWAHPRYRMQSNVFLRRHRDRADLVLRAGQRFPLAVAGNHAQGTTFRDGRHLLTPALEQRIDAIARAYPGFYVGRFDIRYRDVEAFLAGEDLAIVELNGATAESTDIYDPDASLWSAYRKLCQQWSIVFSIGAVNRARGERVTSRRRLYALVRAYLASTPAFSISD